MKNRKVIMEELKQLKEKDSTIFLFHGTGGIAKDLAEILRKNERILCYASAATESKTELLKSYRYVRTYLILTDWRILYIQRGKANIIGVFIPKRTESIPYSAILSFALENVNDKLTKWVYSKCLKIRTKDGNAVAYNIKNKDVAVCCENVINRYIDRNEIGDNGHEDFTKEDYSIKSKGRYNEGYCGYCGSKLLEKAKFCMNCGKEVSIEQNINNCCVNCKNILPDGAICCPYCGQIIVK